MINLNINESVFSLCTNYPELIQVLDSLGFSDISNPNILNTVGRFMTLEKGARLKNIPLDLIKETLLQNGFNLN